MKRLVNGASRVTDRSLASGCPGRCALSIAARNRSTAIWRPEVISSIVRETSVAVSIARSAMLGGGTGGGGSMPIKRSLPSEDNEAATFGYPRVRVF
jgi:hypothetical protein